MVTTILQKYFSLLKISWQDSFALLINPPSLLLLAKATANLVRRVYSWRYYVQNAAVASGLIIVASFFEQISWMACPWVITLVLLIFLGMRPSIQRKDLHYIKTYGIHLFQLALFLAGLTFLANMVFSAWWLLHPLCVGLLSFFILFYCDDQSSLFHMFVALKRAVTMFLFNLPLCFFVGSITWPLGYGIKIISSQLLSSLADMKTWYPAIPLSLLLFAALFLLYPLLIVPWVIFYIKRVNEQESLYFDSATHRQLSD